MLVEKVLEPLPRVGWAKGLKLADYYDYSQYSTHQNRRKYKGYDYKWWAEHLGVDLSTIYDHIRKHGHLDNVGKYSGEYRRQKAIQGANAPLHMGKTIRQWAEHYGVGISVIHKRLREHGTLESYKPRRRRQCNEY